MQRIKKEFIKNILLLFLVIVFCLVFMEIILRLFWEKPGYGYPLRLHIPDETKGYKYNPNFVGTFPGKLYKDIKIKINSRGLRDYEYNYTKSVGVTRILALGDSVTFGAGVELENTFLKKLEKKFNNNGYNIEIINGGVNAYEFYQEYLYYTEELYKYHPDILFVNLLLNDVAKVDIEKIKKQRFGAGIFSYENIKELLRNQCFFCNFVYFNTIVLKNRLSNKGRDYNEQYLHLIYDLWKGDDWTYTRGTMINLINFARSQNTEVIFVIFPLTQQFNNSKLGWGSYPQKVLKKFGKEMNVTVIDLLEYLDIPQYKTLYLYNDDIHLNENGHEMVSNILYLELKEMIKKWEKTNRS